MTPLLVVITGPTAVGKTDLCVAIAQKFDTEIISADSRQFYKELAIGTAKPSEAEMKGVTHHFVNSHSITEGFNANDFELEALNLLDTLFLKHNIVILTGGSGLFIDALCNGFDTEIPDANEEIRHELERLYEKYGISILQEKLAQLDPEFYKEIDLSNHKRLFRAIEVCLITGKPFSALRQGHKQKRPFRALKIALNRDRTELFDRINQRVDIMMETGLLDEVKSVTQYKSYNALNTVGYSELFEHLEGLTNLDQATENIKVNTRRYAKRQINWFTKDGEYQWFHPNDRTEIVQLITNNLSTHTEH